MVKFGKFAFTLAEVLITLGIIGVVAAMTIPTLVNNYQKTQYVTGLQKAYAQVSQVLLQMASDNGTPDSIKDSFSGTDNKWGDKIASYFHIVKNCGITPGTDCFTYFNQSYDGSGVTNTNYADMNNQYRFITNDGVAFVFVSYYNWCTSNLSFATAPDSPPYNSTCGELLIDVNGLKKPNMYGRDIFRYYITSNKVPMLYPDGGFYASGAQFGNLTTGGSDYWNYNGTKNACGPTNKYGGFCSGRIMEKGWKMDY